MIIKAGATAAVSAVALGASLSCIPRARVEVAILLLRIKYAMISPREGTWRDTQSEIQFVLSLERQRRLQYTNLSHVDTGGEIVAAPSPPPASVQTHLVLLGGGHAHAYTLKDYVKNPDQNTKVTLISRVRMTPYSGMLPGYVAGMYSFEECHIDLVKLCEAGNIELILKEATGIDTAANEVVCGAERVKYDILSVDIGSAPSQVAPDLAVLPVKPIDSFNDKWNAVIKAVVEKSASSVFNLSVVGGGASGCEMVLSMEARLRREIKKAGHNEDNIKCTIVSRGAGVLPSHCAAAQREMKQEIMSRDITMVLGTSVDSVKNGVVSCKDGREFAADTVLWCTEAGTAKWLQDTGLELAEGGFIAVNTALQSVSHPNVFASGDCAGFPTPLPKAGVFAVREGPVLTRNLRKMVEHGNPVGQTTTLEPFVPPKSFLGLFGTGHPERCIASRGPMSVTAPFLWELKDWIDRTWMKDYS